ncbi:MAG: hypothetical protein K2G07_08910 [Muribaculaceae bacterium]|nr:hypothetical protein [Muribaculaceae bacterium]
MSKILWFAVGAVISVAVTACSGELADEPRVEPQQPEETNEKPTSDTSTIPFLIVQSNDGTISLDFGTDYTYPEETLIHEYLDNKGWMLDSIYMVVADEECRPYKLYKGDTVVFSPYGRYDKLRLYFGSDNTIVNFVQWCENTLEVDHPEYLYCTKSYKWYYSETNGLLCENLLGDFAVRKITEKSLWLVRHTHLSQSEEFICLELVPVADSVLNKWRSTYTD